MDITIHNETAAYMLLICLVLSAVIGLSAKMLDHAIDAKHADASVGWFVPAMYFAAAVILVFGIHNFGTGVGF